MSTRQRSQCTPYHAFVQVRAPFWPLLSTSGQRCLRRPSNFQIPPPPPIPTAPDLTWDVLLSHASEEKEAVARPLAEAFGDRGVSVWLDVLELESGETLTGIVGKLRDTTPVTVNQVLAAHARLEDPDVVVPGPRVSIRDCVRPLLAAAAASC